MMRSGVSRRHSFRGNITSPFLRHRFADDPTDALLPSLREAAAALCRSADRETLIKVVEILREAQPLDKTNLKRSASQTRLAEMDLRGDDAHATARVRRRVPPPPPSGPGRGPAAAGCATWIFRGGGELAGTRGLG